MQKRDKRAGQWSTRVMKNMTQSVDTYRMQTYVCGVVEG